MPRINHPNGYLDYTIEDNDEITLDMIKVYEPRKGTGRWLINDLKDIAIDLDMPIVLYAEPQDDTIDEEGLKAFYESCGFELSPDDVDGKLYIWKF